MAPRRDHTLIGLDVDGRSCSLSRISSRADVGLYLAAGIAAAARSSLRRVREGWSRRPWGQGVRHVV